MKHVWKRRAGNPLELAYGIFAALGAEVLTNAEELGVEKTTPPQFRRASRAQRVETPSLETSESLSFPFRLGRKALLHLFAIGIDAKRLAEMAVPVRMVDTAKEYVAPVRSDNPPATVAALPDTTEAAPFARLD